MDFNLIKNTLVEEIIVNLSCLVLNWNILIKVILIIVLHTSCSSFSFITLNRVVFQYSIKSTKNYSVASCKVN